jgi:hypothetical protein
MDIYFHGSENKYILVPVRKEVTCINSAADYTVQLYNYTGIHNYYFVG